MYGIEGEEESVYGRHIWACGESYGKKTKTKTFSENERFVA